jgi:DNA-nicking Smr family endonuclease
MAKRPADRTAADRTTTDDAAADARSFRAAVRDVTPLAQPPVAQGLTAPKPRPRRPVIAPHAAQNLDAMMPLVGAVPPGETPGAVTGEGALSYQRSGVRVQVMRRLRRGLYPIDDELDLHGLSQTAARDQLADFIARSRGRGCRCVRIVHGKGYRSGVRGPVLKTAVNLWLRRHLEVMAFVSARAIDGGAGAVYVLLRA